MAVKISIDITAPIDSTILTFSAQVQLLEALVGTEVAIVDLTKIKMHKRPDLDYNFIVDTSTIDKTIDQVIHITPADLLSCLITGTVGGSWTSREFLALIEIRRRLIELAVRLDLTDFTYLETVV